MRTAFPTTAVLLCAMLAPAALPAVAQDHAGHHAANPAATPARVANALLRSSPSHASRNAIDE